MTEKEELVAHILDLKEKSADESIVCHSGFLSAEQLSEAIKLEKSNNKFVDTFYFGGYENAERKIAVFVPKFYNVKSEAFFDFIASEGYNPIDILTVKKDRFSHLTHRDYLGAIMGLGIKREAIGDIIINDEGCRIFCLKSMTAFLCENMKQAGRGQLSVSVSSLDSFKETESAFEVFFASVASMRLDCVTAAAFSLSRNSACEAIKQGLIYVNSSQILKADFILKESDKLVFRGKGKTVIEEIIRENKKGRMHINIKRYL